MPTPFLYLDTLLVPPYFPAPGAHQCGLQVLLWERTLLPRPEDVLVSLSVSTAGPSWPNTGGALRGNNVSPEVGGHCVIRPSEHLEPNSLDHRYSSGGQHHTAKVVYLGSPVRTERLGPLTKAVVLWGQRHSQSKHLLPSPRLRVSR